MDCMMTECYDSFNLPQCDMRVSRFLATFALSFILITNHAFAFMGTDDIAKTINAIDAELSGDDAGLESLLDELEQVAGKRADAYLHVSIDGRNTTLWDVPKASWFYSSVLALTELGIVSGYRDSNGNLTGSYGPANNVTHAEAIKITLGAAGTDPVRCAESSTHPQARGHWAEQYVACAEQKVFGLRSDQGLNEPAKRAEVLHYVLKAFDIEAPNGTPPFADSVSHQYKNDIAYAYALDIVSGDDGKDTFRPDDPINRAEVAKIAKLAIALL
jgi:hypothetical protein